MTGPNDLSNWWLANGYRDLEGLLMEKWDPIGVAGIPQAYDEYRDYVEPLAEILTAGGGADEVAKYLTGIEREMMEIEGSAEQLAKVGTQIVAWYTEAVPT